jgi:hypothetical protein
LAWIFAAAALAVIVGNAAYDAGYKTGQRDLVDPPHQRPLTEDQRNRMLMRTTLPPWRRWLGVAAIVVPNLFFLPYVFVMTRYGGSGWLVLLYIVLYLVLFGVGVWAMERLWRPYSEAQREARARQREASKLRDERLLLGAAVPERASSRAGRGEGQGEGRDFQVPLPPRHRGPARAEGEMNDTAARLWHPWLRINRPTRNAARA